METLLPEFRHSHFGNDLVELLRIWACRQNPFAILRMHVTAHVVIAHEKERLNLLSIRTAIAGKHLEPKRRKSAKRGRCAEIGNVAAHHNTVNLATVEITQYLLYAETVLQTGPCIERAVMQIRKNADAKNRRLPAHRRHRGRRSNGHHALDE